MYWVLYLGSVLLNPQPLCLTIPASYVFISSLVLCAKNLAKTSLFKQPDPFAKVIVDGSGQCHSTAVCRNTVDPKWNDKYDL